MNKGPSPHYLFIDVGSSAYIVAVAVRLFCDQYASMGDRATVNILYYFASVQFLLVLRPYHARQFFVKLLTVSVVFMLMIAMLVAVGSILKLKKMQLM